MCRYVQTRRACLWPCTEQVRMEIWHLTSSLSEAAQLYNISAVSAQSILAVPRRTTLLPFAQARSDTLVSLHVLRILHER